MFHTVSENFPCLTSGPVQSLTDLYITMRSSVHSGHLGGLSIDETRSLYDISCFIWFHNTVKRRTFHPLRYGPAQSLTDFFNTMRPFQMRSDTTRHNQWPVHYTEDLTGTDGIIPSNHLPTYPTNMLYCTLWKQPPMKPYTRIRIFISSNVTVGSLKIRIFILVCRADFT